MYHPLLSVHMVGLLSNNFSERCLHSYPILVLNFLCFLVRQSDAWPFKESNILRPVTTYCLKGVHKKAPHKPRVNLPSGRLHLIVMQASLASNMNRPILHVAEIDSQYFYNVPWFGVHYTSVLKICH